jgi:hypothetical protein
MLNCRCGTICRMSSNFWLRGWQTSTNLASNADLRVLSPTRWWLFMCVSLVFYIPPWGGLGQGGSDMFLLSCWFVWTVGPLRFGNQTWEIPQRNGGMFLSGKIVERASHNHHLLTSLQKMDENGILTAWLQEPNFRPRKSSIIQLVLAPVQFHYSQDSSYCGHRNSWFFTSNMGGSCSFSHQFWEVKLNHQPLQEGYEFWYPQGFGC